MSASEWVRPGHGDSLATLRRIFAVRSPEEGDEDKKTSLILGAGQISEHDRLRYEEVERRAAAGETL